MRLAERDEVRRDYDPSTQLKASVNEQFPAGKMVRIEISDRDLSRMSEKVAFLTWAPARPCI